ncbi:MAG: O-antigen ligase family protein [Elusimicrobia bacterium]|nr:O-antigen ligase family protein [Elusimicrobiota bacterium]
MPKAKAPHPADPRLPAPWLLAAAAFWLVPDQKIVRAKLLALQAAVLLAGALLARANAARREAARRAPLDAPVAALALSGLIFWALSPERAAAETEATRLLFCCLTYWASSRAFADGGPRLFCAAWSAGACAAGAWAVLQAVGGHTRPFASFGNPIFLGVPLAASLPLALAGARAAESGRARAPWIAAIALETAGLALTGSRAAPFGLAAGLALWALARWKGGRRAWALAAAVAAAVAAAWLFRGREWTHGLIWRDALALWRAKPWLGCGLGRFHLELPAFASAALKARWPEGRVVINFAHNEYLQTLVETGPAGLAALLSVPVVALLDLRHREPDANRDACAAGALILFAAAFVSPDLRFGASAFAAFALLGASTRTSASGMPAPTPLTASALLACAWLAAKPALAVRRNATESTFYTGANAARVAELEDRLLRAPGDADAAEELGFLKAKASDFAGAADAFRRAAALDPRRPGSLNNLGNLAYLAGDADGAIAWWEKSLAAAPEQIDARLNLAKLLCERGRLKDCARHLEDVLRRDPSNPKARVLYKKMVE